MKPYLDAAEKAARAAGKLLRDNFQQRQRVNSFAAHDMPDVVSTLIDTYLGLRHEDELFVDTVHRVGIAPFKQRVYAEAREVAHA